MIDWKIEHIGYLTDSIENTMRVFTIVGYEQEGG